MAKFVLKPAQITSGQSMGSDFELLCPSSLQADVIGIQLNYSGTPTGKLEVMGSVDGTNYTPLFLSINGASGLSIAIPTNASPIVIDLYGSSIPYLKLKYTRTSGTGTANVYFTYKRLGE